jgi:hypothetical protein
LRSTRANWRAANLFSGKVQKAHSHTTASKERLEKERDSASACDLVGGGIANREIESETPLEVCLNQHKFFG